MGMFLPEDISQRITLFIEGKLGFPFIKKEELMGTFFILSQMNNRIAGDPTILRDCFAQHIACHKQDQFFEIFQPLKVDHLPDSLRKKLKDRMLLLGYNVKDSSSLPYKSTLATFLMW